LTQEPTRTTAPEIASSKTKNTHVFQPPNQKNEALRSPEFHQEGENDTNLGSDIMNESPQRSQTPMVISSGPSSATRSKTSIYAPSITQHFPSAIHSNDKNNPTNQVKDDNKPIMTRFGRMVRPVQKYVNTTESYLLKCTQPTSRSCSRLKTEKKPFKKLSKKK
jgi:hypothetical protein